MMSVMAMQSSMAGQTFQNKNCDDITIALQFNKSYIVVLEMHHSLLHMKIHAQEKKLFHHVSCLRS